MHQKLYTAFLLGAGISVVFTYGVRAAEERDAEADPPQKFIENLPSTKNLPRVKSQAKSVPAFAKRPSLVVAGPIWTALGPFPIPNGQTTNRTDPVSGRTTVIAVHPTNANIAYVGTAQGGLYRTLDGGSTWTQLMDNATSSTAATPLAIGSVVFDPTNSSTILVGTGEGNLSADSFFGSGLYIITNADGGSPTVSGPYTLNDSSQDVFTGRSIVAIAVDPSNHNNVFVSTSSGVGGIVAAANSIVPDRGLYRSTNAFSGAPTFNRVQVAGTSTNTISTSLVMDPGNANNLVVAFYGQTAADPVGIYRTTNALSATPTFTQTKSLALGINVKLALASVSGTVTVYATTSEGTSSAQGRLYKSTDGGATFGSALSGVNGFAGGQGFYDIAVGVAPTNANNVSVGGATGNNIFLYSTNGGTSFTSSVTGLHADVHGITYAPSNAAIIYHGNDGGIWKSTDSGADWTALNNSTFSATQFQGLALHPTSRNFSIGGTQDNGTEFLQPNATFTRADYGDGGFSLIDQNAPDTTNVTMYHTYYNQTGSLIGTAQVTNVANASDGNWNFYGVGGTANGISSTDSVNFYAPQALGPGNPNTWYFGTDKLYRSTNKAVTAVAVSQTFQSTIPVSAIAISPQNDNVRLVGLNNGKIFATTTGANPMLQVAGAGATNGTTTTPAVGVGHVIIDPNNPAVAYLAFCSSAGGIAHVWKTTNLDALPSGSVTWTAMSSGLPDVAANAFAIDPDSAPAGGSSQSLYVGTDAGVYHSADGGANWSSYGSGFPHVAVFAMEIQNPNAVLRAATHGRGLYETSTALELVSVVSRKTHGGAGTFDINMPLTATPTSGTSGVEDRSDGSGNYTIVFHFTNPVNAGNASVTGHTPSGVGSVNTVSFSGNDMIVNLTGVTSGQVLTLTASGVTDINSNVIGSVGVNIGFLTGDTTGNRSVDASDIAQTKSQSGLSVTSANFREDVTANGTIDASDISLVKANSGTSLP